MEEHENVNLKEIKEGIEFFEKMGRIGRIFLSRTAYYQIVWSSIILVATIVNMVLKNWVVWPIASLVGFFLTTASYSGYLISLLIWGVIAILTVILYRLNIPYWLFSIYILLSIVLGFTVPGLTVKDREDSFKLYSPIGIRIGIIWTIIISSAAIFSLTFARTGTEWGFIIIFFVGIGYLITGVLFSTELLLTGFFITLINILFFLILKSYFYLSYITFCASALFIGVYMKVKYGKSGSNNTRKVKA